MYRLVPLAAALLMIGCASAAPCPPAVSTPPVASQPPRDADGFTSLPDSARPGSGGDHPDPLHTDGDKYSLLLENDQVRVLRYHDSPGAKTSPHYHRPFVLYALGPFRRRLVLADGTVKERDFLRGDVIWMPAQIHTGENVGSTDTDVIIVESKAP
jgi:quercetin dioxygenase-like cupin family protein